LQSRNSIARKVTLGVGVIVFGAAVAMFTTYFMSSSATSTIQESQDRSQAMINAAAGMEVSTISGALQVFKYLETGDAYYRQSYGRSSDQFRQHYDRFLALAHLKEWQAAGSVIAGYHKQFDQISLEAMANHERQQAEAITRERMQRLLELQQQITSTIATRIRPTLSRHIEDSRNRMDTHVIRVLLVAGGMSMLLSLLAIAAGRYLRLSIIAPIQKLATGADAVASGDLSHRVSVGTNDEFGDLAKNFNHMVDQLQGTTVSKSLHEEQELQLRALLDGVHDYAIFSIDDNGFVTKWNQASTRILGYDAEDMQGVSFARIFKDTQKARITRDEGLLAIAAGGHFETDTTLQRKDGETFDANMVVTPFGGGEDVKGYSVVIRDITERIKAERHIEQLATKDALTGLSNRSMLMEQMNTAIARAMRSGTQLVVMFIDLDRFKAVNDTLGHAAGDELLRECAKRLTECVREMDIVARLGGDEFVVLLTDVTDTGIVSPIADRMLKLLTTPYLLQHTQEASTSASIGICFYPSDGTDVATLMKNADIAMYHAKELNRNNYQFYAEEMNRRMLERIQLERELRAAVQNNEFVLHYQPQVIVASGLIRGAESLLRWNHPTKGLVSPTSFISIVEETGLILPLGEWILNEACRTIKSWRENGIGIPYVVVNVSAAQLSDGLVTSVRQALIKHDIEPGWLMLEITETMLMERVEEAISILRRIRELGIRIAMDDFGTGYSSLSVLQRLPLDTLKIDRSFVIAIDDEVNNSRAVAIIGAIIAIAKELNLSVVAEGVDSTTQLAFLRTLNCDTYQGYLYSKPLDAATLELQFAAPVKSVLEDEEGRAITMTTKVTMELPVEIR